VQIGWIERAAKLPQRHLAFVLVSMISGDEKHRRSGCSRRRI
jgi:hypothetical protein